MNHVLDSSTPGTAWLNIVREKVSGIRFGVVQIVIHEGKVTQIEATEKTRLDGPAPTSRSKR